MWWMNEILKSLFVKAVFTSSTLEWVPSAIQVSNFVPNAIEKFECYSYTVK